MSSKLMMLFKTKVIAKADETSTAPVMVSITNGYWKNKLVMTRAVKSSR